MRLGLGTVQFGLDYGVNNPTGQTLPDEVGTILDLAVASGIRDFDTAALYGNSESVLGQFSDKLEKTRIVTKTPHFTNATDGADARAQLRAGFRMSCQNLCVDAVYGLLIHGVDDLLGPFGGDLVAEMEALKREGRIKAYGFSAYTGQQIDAVLARYDIDMVQLPLNVFDQRLIVGGQLAALKARNVEIFARSLFLQGILLMDPQATPAHFTPIRKHLQGYHEAVWAAGSDPLAAALAFVDQTEAVDVGLVGVNASNQLQEILDARAHPVAIDFSVFAIDDPKFVDPTRWPKEGA